MLFANTPAPPYYAVIFTSQRNENDPDGYHTMADLMAELASKQPGFLGVESAREENGLGITVSYWDSLEAIQQWKENRSHMKAQKKGKNDWYSSYKTRICKVERDYTNSI
ncbi:antibiotic biosynthesis monooxygenase family protein [Lysinibacillus sp. 3P01SB]|uniref:antibiotic biosynthesis monooxygenase family protein n=1 Tax=Lysinibacillus sp. 3P01SB TaxID=3132284 RepID=UPI0039A7712D